LRHGGEQPRRERVDRRKGRAQGALGQRVPGVELG
jgi:hypothetical protein